MTGPEIGRPSWTKNRQARARTWVTERLAEEGLDANMLSEGLGVSDVTIRTDLGRARKAAELLGTEALLYVVQFADLAQQAGLLESALAKFGDRADELAGRKEWEEYDPYKHAVVATVKQLLVVTKAQVAQLRADTTVTVDEAVGKLLEGVKALESVGGLDTVIDAVMAGPPGEQRVFLESLERLGAQKEGTATKELGPEATAAEYVEELVESER